VDEHQSTYLTKLTKKKTKTTLFPLHVVGSALFLYWRNFAKKRNYNLENEVISKGFNSQKSKGKKTPVFYIWFPICSHKRRIFILNICTSYPVPKDDGHFCYEGSPLRLHKKFLKKKTLVGISFMHVAPDSS